MLKEEKGGNEMLYDLVVKNRSYRRFYEEEKIDKKTLENLVDLARLSASGANLQSLKYIISNEPKKNNKIYPNLRWAGYMKDWDGPEPGERPSAYIIILMDKEIANNCFWDHGIACQSILLGATELGLGGCIFASMDKKALAEELSIPDRYEILTALAIGKPKEKIVLEKMNDPKDIKYWRDEEGIHHVPKRELEDIILNL